MKLINQYYEAITEEQVLNEKETMFWEYNINETDFFLKSSLKWYNLKTDVYVLKILEELIYVPANYYIIIGDYDKGLDTIKPLEIVGREFSVLTFSAQLKSNSWELHDLEPVGYEEDYNFVLPDVKAPFPIIVTEKKAILISEKDVYNRLKYLTFSDIL